MGACIHVAGPRERRFLFCGCRAPQEAWAAQIEEAGFQQVGYESVLGGIVALHSGFKLPAGL